mmetsp:Transcript_68201/g.76350  ORF Transcript_68201/g.76350 Transcript_68201/m.76350 type:complete len:444 (+) Transcript_68201:43-1374(+)
MAPKGKVQDPTTTKGRAPRSHGFYDNEILKKHPASIVDHRPSGGPLLSLLWSKEKMNGQTLYLGGEVGVDGKIYCIPGHAPRVLVIDPLTDELSHIGPDELSSNGTKFKWLRGITVGDVIYGLPCHASEVLRIHVPTQTITKISIPYEEFYPDPKTAKEQRKMIWKYHGGDVCGDGCMYAVPQSAWHVLKIDPSTDTCSLVGPRLTGKYKWYGGVESMGAIYCSPQNSPHVLRISPNSITLHGDYGDGGHKWHGAAKADDGSIVCIPNNVDRVLLINPGDTEPTLTEIGDETVIQTGRHRSDRKYKYLGAMAGFGKVYFFPSGSEYVLQVDTKKMIAKNIGPNLRDAGMERIFQNKWQNGLTNPHDKCVYAIPLSGETLLQIDCSKDDDAEPVVTTWPLPSPFETLDKWEGGVMCDNGLMYTMPNNCKAVLKIQPCNWKPEYI